MPNANLLIAAHALLHRAGGMLTREQLNKLLFYFDLYWMDARGETFTGAVYLAFPRGPVVANYKDDLIGALEAGNLAVRGTIEPLPGQTVKYLKAVGAPPAVDPEAARLMDKLIEGTMRGVPLDLTDFSHHNIGWRSAKRTGMHTPISMTLAYQQLAPPDPWMDDPLSEAEQTAITAALLDRAGAVEH